VQPTSVLIGQGNTSGSFTVRGLAAGSATIMANSSGFSSGTANLTVGLLGAILLPANVKVGPNQSVAFPVTLATPAPVGGVTIMLKSSDTNVATVPMSVFIDFKATTPAVQPQVTGIKPGSVTITASAVGFPDASSNVSVVPVLTITTTSLAGAMIGTPYSQTLTAVGGTGTYTWSVIQGRLPPGLTLNQSTGEISGTPTTQVAGSSVTFQVTDMGNPQQMATASFTMSATF